MAAQIHLRLDTPPTFLLRKCRRRMPPFRRFGTPAPYFSVALPSPARRVRRKPIVKIAHLFAREEQQKPSPAFPGFFSGSTSPGTARASPHLFFQSFFEKFLSPVHVPVASLRFFSIRFSLSKCRLLLVRVLLVPMSQSRAPRPPAFRLHKAGDKVSSAARSARSVQTSPLAPQRTANFAFCTLLPPLAPANRRFQKCEPLQIRQFAPSRISKWQDSSSSSDIEAASANRLPSLRGLCQSIRTALSRTLSL